MFLTRQYPLHPMLKKRGRKHKWQNALCILTYFCLTLFLDTCISINKCMIFHCLYENLELKNFFLKSNVYHFNLHMLLKEKDLKIQRNIYDYRFASKFNIFKRVSGILDCFVDDLQLLVIFQLFVSFYSCT